MKNGLLAVIDHYLASVREFAKSSTCPRTALDLEAVLQAAKGRIELLQQVADRLRADLDQAHATIKEMGDLIDQQAAEIERLKLNVNYMVEGCTCNRALGVPVETVNEIRGTV